MTSLGILQIAIFLALILVCTKPLGSFMARVFEGERTFLHPVLRWLEVLTYKVAGVREDVEQKWTHYTASLLSFSIFGFVTGHLIGLWRGWIFIPLGSLNLGLSSVGSILILILGDWLSRIEVKEGSKV